MNGSAGLGVGLATVRIATGFVGVAGRIGARGAELGFGFGAVTAGAGGGGFLIVTVPAPIEAIALPLANAFRTTV
jgi:hypothetical protein